MNKEHLHCVAFVATKKIKDLKNLYTNKKIAIIDEKNNVKKLDEEMKEIKKAMEQYRETLKVSDNFIIKKKIKILLETFQDYYELLEHLKVAEEIWWKE